MLNLIFKDILMQKRVLPYGILYIMIMIFAFQKVESNMFPASVMAFSYILVQSACAYDDKNKSDVMLNSLPISRSTIVGARYVSTFVFAAISIVTYTLLTGIIKALELPFKAYPVTLEGIMGALFALILITGIYFPVLFKLGYLKSKVVNFVLFFALFFGVTAFLPLLISKNDGASSQEFLQFLSKQSDILVAVVLFAVMLLLFTISYMISLYIYRRREF